ncbi:MAG: hypothetical protein AAB367_01150 [Patescibacteria group bacterium]
MNSNQDAITRKSEYRLAAVGILALIVAVATIVQMNYIIDDIDRIAEKQQEQQNLLLKSIQEHVSTENP